MIIKGTGGLGSRRMSGDHPNDSIIENVQKTKKSPGDFRRLAVSQIPVKRTVLFLSAFSPWRHEKRDTNYEGVC